MNSPQEANTDRTFVSGFGAFGTVTDNPSAKLAESCERPFQLLEVSYHAVDQFLAGLAPELFDRLLLMGVATARDHLSLELFGRNCKNNTPDVAGIGSEGVIEESAPLLLQSTLWTAEVAAEIVAYDVHVRVSFDAGEYLCNYIYYRALQRFPDKQVGFLHVPSFDKISFDEQMKSLKRILEIIER